jgi:hypothetical protein
MVERCPTWQRCTKREAKESSTMSKILPPPQAPQADTLRRQRLASLAPAPLLADEDPAAYETLLEKVVDAVKPGDFIEEIWVRDIVDHTWQALRYRRLKAALLNMRTYCPLQTTVDRYNLMLGRPHVEGEAGMAMTLEECLDSVERIEHLTALAESRRAATFREIERHRDVLAKRLHQAVRQLEDAEYKELEQHTPPAPAKDNKAA